MRTLAFGGRAQGFGGRSLRPPAAFPQSLSESSNLLPQAAGGGSPGGPADILIFSRDALESIQGLCFGAELRQLISLRWRPDCVKFPRFVHYAALRLEIHASA